MSNGRAAWALCSNLRADVRADFSPGFLSAPDPAATEMRIAAGWAAQGIMNSPSGVMVSNQRHADQ